MLFRKVLLICSCLFSFVFFSCGVQEETSEICFVGDSITRLWDLEFYFSGRDIHKHAVSGAIIEDVAKWDTKDCKGIPTVMLIGTNNLILGMENDTLTSVFIDDFISKYIHQVKEFKASTFYAVSILPRNFLWKQNKKINEEIQKLNEKLEGALDASGVSYKFISLHEYFLSGKNEIEKDYYFDGLHLTQEGYEVLSWYVEDAL